MTEFRVLPLREGDAFLLRSPRGTYLMNGGGFGCGLTPMLLERGTRKVRAAICTTASPDALGGLLELMRSEVPVGEYWLPEGLALLPELALRFNGDLSGWLERVTGVRTPLPPRTIWPLLASYPDRPRLLGAAALLALAQAAVAGSWRDVLPEKYGRGAGPYFLRTIRRVLAQEQGRDGLFGSMPETLSGSLREADLALLCGRLLLARLGREETENGGGRAIARTLVLAAMGSAQVELTDVRRRYFRPVGRLTDHLVARHPLLCLNGVEAEPLPGLGHTVGPETIFREAAALGRDERGLVFRYGDAGCGALFLGDSRLQFLGRGEFLRLDRSTVVTAPGQGSCRQEAAYARIASDRPAADIWVRGYLPRARKVAASFCRQHNVFCLNHCRTGVLREILLRFEDGAWIPADDDCCRNGR